MTRTTAVRLGIPVSGLARRILIPAGAALLAVVAILSAWQFDRVQARVYQDQRSALRTVFEFSSPALHGNSGLATMARNRGYERIWVLSATGDVLSSNRHQEVGTSLEDRWWSHLRSLPSGLHQQTVRFGNQDLELLSLNSVEMGRQVAILTRGSSFASTWLLNVAGILGAGLILWVMLAGLLILNLRRRVEAPTRKLDEKALELVRGTAVTDVQWDRLHAEVVGGLEGHADCMVDLARKVHKQDLALSQSTSRYGVLFNALPSPAFVLDDARRVVDANEALSDAMGIDPAWLCGRDLSVLNEWIPTDRLVRWLDTTKATPVGVRRMRTAPDRSPGESAASSRDREMFLTMAPIPASAGRGHIVIVEEGMPEASAPDDPSPVAVEKREMDEARETRAPRDAVKPSTKHAVDSVPEDVSAAFATASSVSGDGRAGIAPEPVISSVQDGEAQMPDRSSGNVSGYSDLVLDAAGVVAIAFNEEAETVFWSDGAVRLTGLTRDDIPDLKAFARKVFPHERERKLFRSWLDSEPEDRSQELKLRSRKGILSTVWRAGEWNSAEEGEIGVLWTHLPAARLSAPLPPEREPSLPSSDS